MNIDEIDFFITKNQYMELTQLSPSAFSRRVNHTENPIVFTVFELNTIKYLKTNKFDDAIATAIRAGGKVELIDIRKNPVIPSNRAR